MARMFNVVLLKSFDMTSGEVFSGVFSVDDYEDFNLSYAWQAALDHVMDAYEQQCIGRSTATGIHFVPEKIVSVVMTEIV